MKIAIDTSSLQTGHQARGIGSYTKLLIDGLAKCAPDVIVTDVLNDPTAQLVHYPYFDLFYHTLHIDEQKPKIVTIHDVIPLIFRRHFPIGIRGHVRLFLQKRELRKTAAVITVSEHSKKDISKYLAVPESKIFVTPLSVPSQYRTLLKDELRHIKARYDLPDQFVLYVGDVNYHKNVIGLVEAFDKLASDVELILVGKALADVAIPEVQAIDQAIVKCAKAKLIRKLGFVAHEDLPAIYNLATVSVLPSLYEGFGLPILEAMSCGTPVVCGNISSMVEVAGDAAYLCDTNNIQELCHAIDQVITDESLAENLRQHGLLRAKKFTIARFTDATLAAYTAVLNQKP